MKAPQIFDQLEQSATDGSLSTDLDKYLKKNKRLLEYRNENPIGPSPTIKTAATSFQKHFQPEIYLHCDFHVEQLKKEIALAEGVSVDQVFLGPGSRYVLQNILSWRAAHGSRKLVMPYPDYSHVPTFAEMLGYAVQRVDFSRDQWNIPLEKIFKAAESESVVYFSNPHLPYGTFFEPDALLNLLPKHRDKLVLLDEAYIEFLGPHFRKFSGVSLLNQHPNLVVVRTFSKIYGLAASRIGYAIFSEGSKGKHIFDRHDFRIVNPFAAHCSSLALRDHLHLKKTSEFVNSCAEQLEKLAQGYSFSVQHKFGNFFLVRIPRTERLEKLLDPVRKSKIWSEYAFDYWYSSAHSEFQTYLSLQRGDLLNINLKRLHEILLAVGSG